MKVKKGEMVGACDTYYGFLVGIREGGNHVENLGVDEKAVPV
jgi:hypothetical protein